MDERLYLRLAELEHAGELRGGDGRHGQTGFLDDRHAGELRVGLDRRERKSAVKSGRSDKTNSFLQLIG